MNKIQIKRGLESSRSSVTPDTGELLYTTDNQDIFVGDGATAGGVQIGGSGFSTLVGDSSADLLHKHSKLSNPSDDSTIATVDSDGDIGFGTAFPDGLVHIFRSDTSIVPNTVADELLIEGTGNTGISFLGSTSSIHSLLFGDTDDNDIGSIKYTHGDSVTADNLAFVVDTASILTLFQDAVGINETSPQAPLHISRQDVIRTDFIIENESIGDSTGTEIGAIDFMALDDDSVGNRTTYGRILSSITDPANASEDGKIDFQVMFAGTLSTLVTVGSDDGALDIAGEITLTDGITAPSSSTGKAKIYVDSADGDLKIIFADGIVKTITTDT